MAEQIMPETDPVSLGSVARKSKLLARVRWGINSAYVGRKANSVLAAIQELKDLGFSESEILAETGAGAGVNLIEEIETSPAE